MEEKEKEEINLGRLRTELSIRQTMYASKRTFLTYISTACVFVSLAFTYLKIGNSNKIDVFVIIMFSIGLFFFVFGMVEYFLNRKKTVELFKKYGFELEKQEKFEDYKTKK